MSEFSAVDLARAYAVARESGEFLESLALAAPTTIADAYAVHFEMAKLLGPIGGWKVGAAGVDAVPTFAPMPLRWFNLTAMDGGVALIAKHRRRGVEAEIAYVMGKDLPTRDGGYSREEVVAAIAGCAPAIELLESAFVDPTQQEKMCTVADLQNNGGFVPGVAIEDWQKLDCSTEAVEVIVNGKVEVARVASNVGGPDLIRLVEWMANVGTVPYGGLKAGQWITTGSWTGNTPCVDGAEVVVKFSTAGEVKLRFV